MKSKHLLLSAALVALLPFAAHAQSKATDGVYVSLGAGLNLLDESDETANGRSGKTKYETGYAVLGAVGYGWGNGLRTELEGGYRNNTLKSSTFAGTNSNGNGSVSSLSLMANAIYDFNLGSFTPYLGAGIGVARLGAGYASAANGYFDDYDMQFAYQGIAGVAYALTNNWKLDLGYRYFGTTKPSFSADNAATNGPSGATLRSEYGAHTVLLSVRYEFGAPPPPPPPAAPVAVPPPPPPPPPPAPPSIQRAFIVFFDFDRADITPEASRIIKQAADTAKRGSVPRIVVTGHTDLSGSVAYNQRLSERRAEAVRQALVREGLTAGAISTIGRGKTQPLVPTADGVREPQNRRAEIVLQ
jgi:OOP family OmpA-OmpF porin